MKKVTKSKLILLFIIVSFHISVFANQPENICSALCQSSSSRINKFDSFNILSISLQSQNPDAISTVGLTCSADDIKSFFEHTDSNLSFSEINREYMFGPIYAKGKLMNSKQLWHYSIDISGGWGSWFQVDENGKIINEVYFGCSSAVDGENGSIK